MRSIMFTLRTEVGDDERAALLKRLSALPGVVETHPLRPQSKSAAVRRMYYATVGDDADIERVRQRLEAAPEVEAAELPSERRLM